MGALRRGLAKDRQGLVNLIPPWGSVKKKTFVSPYHEAMAFPHSSSAAAHSPLRILIATGNPHKVGEVRAIVTALAGAGQAVELLSLADLPGGKDIPEPHEGEDSFEGNAVLKARYYADKTGFEVWADDSGLAVDALGGAPGVLSARYSGASGPRSVVDPANNRKLMEVLRAVPKDRRQAQFVCALAWCAPGRAEPLALVRGAFAGRILLDEECADPAQPEKGRGSHGFGYDPLLWIEDARCTSAELPPEAKNARSHRGAAVRAMMEKVRVLRPA